MKEKFTYEVERERMLETYEWDNIWWEHAEDEEKNRILLVGDSISCGYRGFINKILDKKAFADGIGTSKSLANDSLIALIDYVFVQKKNYKIIQFNNGLHGWHLSADEYEYYYDKTIKHIKEKYPEVKVVIALTTPLRNKEKIDEYDKQNAMVKERNNAAIKVAKKHGLAVNDLYSVIEDFPQYYKNDGVHLNDEGYEKLAQKCVEVFKNIK